MLCCCGRQAGAVAAVTGPSTSGRPFVSSYALIGSSSEQLKSASAAFARKTRTLCRSALAEGQLISWLELPANKVAVREDSSGALATIKRVPRGQTLLSVPSSYWMSVDTVAKSAIGPYVGELQPWVQLALLILFEKANSRSRWQLYFKSLPTALDTPLLWSDAELEELLGGTQLLDSIYGYRQFFSSKFEELSNAVFPQAPDLFDRANFTEEEFLWAAAVLRGRAHSPLDGNSLALVPLADKVTHQRGPGAFWKLSSGGFGRGESALVVEAQRDFNSGEVVVMDFGPDKLDSDILLNYGAMDDFVTRAGFTLNLALPEGDRFVDDKADILDINGLSESQEFLLLTDQEPSVDLLAYLRLINLSGTDAFLLESLFRNDAWGHLQKPVSLENERAVFGSMIEGCREALAGYGGSTAENKAALQAAEEGSHMEKALRIRIGEREALETTLQFFEERVERLDRLEYYQERRLKGLGLLDEEGRSTFDDFFKDGIA